MAHRSENCDPFGDVDLCRALPSPMRRDEPRESMLRNFVQISMP
jgi:hypothetical protein